MRQSLKHLASLVMIPIVRWYLRKERRYTYQDVIVHIQPGVFHPGFFSSTKFLLAFLEKQNLKKQSLLELGCGSGLISVVAAKRGANVTASDLSEKAIKNTQANARLNQVAVDTIFSDLFENIPPKRFDWIVINPPYYAQTPQNDSDLAWYCGENFEYFTHLFQSLNNYILESTEVIMVLTKGCDVSTIIKMANRGGFQFQLIREKKVFFDEKDFLYRIKKVNSSL